MNRIELRQLALDRIEDAKILLDNRRWAAAYYLAGYAVECGLKACILARVERTGIIFTDPKFAKDCWTHSLVKLIEKADLVEKRDDLVKTNLVFRGNWGIVKDWTEISRYAQRTEGDANAIYEAIVNDPDGVLKWLQTLW